MERYKKIFEAKKSKGFVIQNRKTNKETKYPYTKGVNPKDAEAMAIKDQMEVTKQPREDFWVVDFWN